MFTPRIQRGRLTRALVLENPDPSLDDQLERIGFSVHRETETPDEDRLLQLIAEHRPQLIFKRSRVEITERVVAAADDLYGVMLCCIGDDSVDKQATAARGIVVLNDPRSNGRSVVEMVIGQMLAGARRIPDAWGETSRSEWKKSASGRYEVNGKVLGVLGLGSIGSQVARVASSLGMRIRFYDNSDVAQAVGATMDWEPVHSIGELFEASDVLTVHLSAEDLRGRSNRNVITGEHFMAMGRARASESPGVFINMGRGTLYEPTDLLAAVKAGRVKQAFVDVFPVEPRNASESWTNPYAEDPRIHTTPHIGAATREAQPRIAKKMARATRQFSHQGTVDDCVYAPKRRIDVASTAEAPHILSVVHADVRGTKKAVDDAIYAAGVNNLQSVHRDFPRYGIAYDLSVLDRALTDDELQALIGEARELTGREDAIRAIRQVEIE
ncbi:MAG: 3-phosphoglycerate dehydrogenase [Deltaproteobacteria bacterium]|nr:3-phosphoglycerate dehydrogenase [Deltaproteobacteria bacterium]